MNTGEITGHRHQLALLSHMLETGTTPQAMLFTGMSGIGKAKTALHFFSSLFCAGAERPCGSCKNCLQIEKGLFPDLIELRPDEKGKIPLGNPDKREAGSIRWLIEALSRKALSGTMGVLIDGVDTIAAEGQNALLKSIEEPQAGTHIILIGANRSRVLPTIISRCTVIPFNPLSTGEVREIMTREGMDGKNRDLVASIAGGSLEIAGILARKGTLDKVIDLCGHISAYLNNGTAMRADPGQILKEISADVFLTVLINIYRILLMESINRGGTAGIPETVAVGDRGKVRKFIKILLALKKGLAHNLNVKIALKGMLYALDGMDERCSPEIASILY